jgi:hypothetical protein
MKWSEPKSEGGLAKAAQPLMRFRATPILGLSLVWLLSVGDGRAQESQPTEYQIKAAFLFNFAKFVEWPPAAFAEATSPMIIGILGDNPFGEDLEKTVSNKTVNNRPITIKKEFRSLADATNCHMLFISTSEKQRLPEIFKALRGASVLTVGETDRFTETGGMINFVLEGNKTRFQINEATAKSAGLKISSKLLSLALRTAR